MLEIFFIISNRNFRANRTQPKKFIKFFVKFLNIFLKLKKHCKTKFRTSVRIKIILYVFWRLRISFVGNSKVRVQSN